MPDSRPIRPAFDPNTVPLGVSIIGLAEWWQVSMDTNARLHGLPSLNRSQAFVVAYVSLGETRPIRLAEKLQISRQAIHHIIIQLVGLGILVLTQDPADKRAPQTIT